MNIALEKQVIRWLMQIVGHKLDPDQFGGQKGNSVSHYLIEMTNFILYNQDLKDPQAALAAFLDYKQGFNICQHSIFIDILSEEFDANINSHSTANIYNYHYCEIYTVHIFPLFN